jgi:hypothetical protein
VVVGSDFMGRDLHSTNCPLTKIIIVILQVICVCPAGQIQVQKEIFDLVTEKQSSE